ncbi:helix-turn-helix domain-containing protein [Roseburia sp. 499]|uniref:helix-turn-helix domain-containing protein n=1 Tax=Roseburia sp. 499 TaxID=1261634 RepID=UPI000951B3E4|nr:helix-turn-helix transcriptional regulator [Roseburia sp. 499]WVK70292.1 helix-turn-helix transcriptional regulator [Roseburia sp. 499]
MKFGTRLENLLEERNISQKQLSKELHIAPSTLNGYLRRNREPDFTTLIDLATYFDVSTDYLLGITNLRLPSTPTDDYNNEEGDLISIYRALKPREQNYLLKQAHIYYDQDMDSTTKKK